MLVLLAGTRISVGAALIFAVFYGLSNGVMTIVRGTVPAEFFGRAAYGSLLGRLAAPSLVARAAAPVALAALAAPQVSPQDRSWSCCCWPRCRRQRSSSRSGLRAAALTSPACAGKPFIIRRRNTRSRPHAAMPIELPAVPTTPDEHEPQTHDATSDIGHAGRYVARILQRHLFENPEARYWTGHGTAAFVDISGFHQAVGAARPQGPRGRGADHGGDRRQFRIDPRGRVRERRQPAQVRGRCAAALVRG